VGGPHDARLTHCVQVAQCNGCMNRAGIREARQNLSALIAEVEKGRQIVITDRGRAAVIDVRDDRL